ncbi:DUF6170 family protein [Thalassotalea sp. 1_MG-2023]|uniref:DUF6170 family protein n=1 Tax=Thalassotalea sp. 1_MG-2023 TaxID=3062680 RepID=UPI0034A160B8
MTMAFYLSSKNISKLKDCSLKERKIKIADAQNRIPAPQKFILNILKLVILIPPFFFLSQQSWGYLALSLLLSLIFYFFIAVPIKLQFCLKYL